MLRLGTRSVLPLKRICPRSPLELVDKAARSIKYQLTIAKLPLAKELADFVFKGTPITRPWSAILPPAASAPNSATSCWRAKPKRASSPCHRDRSLLQWCPRPVLQCRRFGQPARSREPQRPGLRRLSDPHRLPAVCPVRWPATPPPDLSSLRTQLDHRDRQSRFRRMAERQNDCGFARPAHSPLRYRREWERKLALQKPRLIFQSRCTK